jgi:C-terminal processing protease CtpA/Prc
MSSDVDRPMKHALCAITAALLIAIAPRFAACAQDKAPQSISNQNRGQVDDMLKQIHDTLKANYYDPTFNGVDMDARYKEYATNVENARSVNEAFHIIAAYLSALHDSHTYFIPPLVSYRFDYGFQMQMIGNRCFITQVRPGSDAAAKVHAGDEVLKISAYDVTRSDFEDLEYYLHALSPQPTLNLQLRDPQGATRTEQVVTKFIHGFPTTDQLILHAERGSHMLRERKAEVADTFIWKIPTFIVNHDDVDRAVGNADKHGTLVVDLRGNSGGFIDALAYLTGCFFDHTVTIANRIGRKHQGPLVAKPHGKTFTGKLLVLVDSGSASASEVFARTIQLNRRGTIVGDLTEGAVMEARVYPLHAGVDVRAYYGLSVTAEDLVMTDGKSLEKIGVTPDVVVVPTAADLAAGRDPALARAAQLAGVKLDPAEAGKLFPFEWAPLDMN